MGVTHISKIYLLHTIPKNNLISIQSITTRLFKMGELKYREASLDELDQLLELNIISYTGFSEVLSAEKWEEFHKRLSNKDTLRELMQKAKIFVCTDGDMLIGVAYFMPNGNPTPLFSADWCYIRMVGVHPGYRGMSIGRKLTELCIAYARQTNEQTIALHTSEFMNAARHIYESLGFTILREIDPIFGKRYWLYTLDISGGIK